MADRQFPIIEGEPQWATGNFTPLDPFHFQDSMRAAGFHIGESGDYEPTYRGEPAVIDLYAMGPAYNDPLRSNQPGVILPVAPPAPVAPVVTPISPSNQVNGAPALASVQALDSTWLVLGIAAVVGIAILS